MNTVTYQISMKNNTITNPHSYSSVQNVRDEKMGWTVLSILQVILSLSLSYYTTIKSKMWNGNTSLNDTYENILKQVMRCLQLLSHLYFIQFIWYYLNSLVYSSTILM